MALSRRPLQADASIIEGRQTSTSKGSADLLHRAVDQHDVKEECDGRPADDPYAAKEPGADVHAHTLHIDAVVCGHKAKRRF